jgi:hypothetical protein
MVYVVFQARDSAGFPEIPTLSRFLHYPVLAASSRLRRERAGVLKTFSSWRAVDPVQGTPKGVVPRDQRVLTKAKMNSKRDPARITHDGRIYRKYDPKAIPLIKSLNGAKWNHRGGFWDVSVTKEDLPSVLWVCRQLDVEVDPALLK